MIRHQSIRRRLRANIIEVPNLLTPFVQIGPGLPGRLKTSWTHIQTAVTMPRTQPHLEIDNVASLGPDRPYVTFSQFQAFALYLSSPPFLGKDSPSCPLLQLKKRSRLFESPP
jgi:hypothetical protein